MRKKLTPKTIDALPTAAEKRYEVRDTLVIGLLLRVSPTGKKVWYVCTRIEGRLRRIKIGSYPTISLADARSKSQAVLREIQLGQYHACPEPPSSVPTFGEIVPQFIELYAKPRNRDWRGTQRVLGKFASLRSKPIDDVRRADVVRILDAIVANGTPFRANRALAAIKKLMAWCVDRGTIQVNPVAGLKPPTKEVSRDRVLSDEELLACWRASEAEGFPFEPFIKILLLTGQRRGEVSAMRWSEIDLNKMLWAIPAERTKNATQHTVPLAPAVINILRAIPRFLNSDLVFTTTGKTPISGFGRLKDRLDATIEKKDWRFHDLRRTVATNLAIMGTPPHVIEAVLNHKSGIVSGVAAVYNRHAYLEEKRTALERWAQRVEEIERESRNSVSSEVQPASLVSRSTRLSGRA
jgi:integrase